MARLESIAVAQTVPRRGDVRANLEQHLELARLAAQHSAQVVVFPELSLTGYELDLGPELAFGERDERLRSLTEFAASAGLVLIVGAPLRVGAELHIGAFILDAQGGSRWYAKQHLGAFPAQANPDGPVPPAEASLFTAGKRSQVFELSGATAAVAVCADIGHSSHAQIAAEAGASCYLCSMFVIPADFAAERAALTGYARQHAMDVAFANYGGPSGGLPSAGQSAIWSEHGDLLVELPEVGAGIAVSTLRTRTPRAVRVMLERAVARGS